MKIECTIPNASDEISGVKFVKTDHGTVVSAGEVDPKVAARLLKISGFHILDGKPEGEGDKPAAPNKPPAGKK